MEVSYGTLEAGLIGHHVPHMAAVQFGDRQYERVEWRDVAAHDGLQCQNHRGERLDRAGALVRVAGVCSGGVQGHVEFHAARHHRFGADGHLSRRIVRIVMRADGRRDIAQQSGVNHGTGTGSRLFGRLEQQFDGTLDLLAMLGEPECGAKKIRHMQVVPASMHHAVVHGCERQAGILLNRQTVDIGAQGDARTGFDAAYQGDDA